MIPWFIDSFSIGFQMAGRGGKRAGSGRKSKAETMGILAVLDKAWPLERRIAWFKTLAKLAETSPDERIRIDAGKVLADRYYGKATEHHQITGGLQIKVIDESSES